MTTSSVLLPIVQASVGCAMIVFVVRMFFELSGLRDQVTHIQFRIIRYVAGGVGYVSLLVALADFNWDSALMSFLIMILIITLLDYHKDDSEATSSW